MTQFLQAWQLYPMLPMKQVSVLPDEGMDWTDLPITRYLEDPMFPVMILHKDAPMDKRKQYNAGTLYRVIVKCRCGKYMPFGKMGQHFGSKACGVKP